MELLSRAWRTDLALLEQGGSRVEHRPTCVVVTTPDDPTYRWGNFVLLRRLPMRRSIPPLLERFAELVPGVGHVAFGIDDPGGSPEDLERFADAGFRVDAATVLTASSLRPPPHPNPAVEIRLLSTDDDWEQRVALAVACNETEPTEAFALFATRRAEAERRVVEQGHGEWFGAFDDGRMLAGLGVFRAGDGLGRFQEVETHPEARGHGLAGTLVHAAGTFALTELGVTTLVVVADPEAAAVRIYRSVGFTDTETQLQAVRAG